MQNILALNRNSLIFSDLKLYLMSGLLVASTVFFPSLLHHFGIAGQAFLPLYFFSLLAGLTYGWRCGLIVGILSPLVSFFFSGMPALTILPFVIIKSLSTGLSSGLLTEKFKTKNIFLLTLSSILFTQLIGLILIFSFTSNLNLALMDFKIGHLGLLLQLAFIPLLSQTILKYENKISKKDY